MIEILFPEHIINSGLVRRIEFENKSSIDFILMPIFKNYILDGEEIVYESGRYSFIRNFSYNNIETGKKLFDEAVKLSKNLNCQYLECINLNPASEFIHIVNQYPLTYSQGIYRFHL